MIWMTKISLAKIEQVSCYFWLSLLFMARARRRYRDIHLIVEHNVRFVYPDDYGKAVVKEGDRIEFINPNFGG